MSFFLRIEARLPNKPAGLELWARLLALRPRWDIETSEDGLSFYLPHRPGRNLDAELGALEEACARLESQRPGLEISLSVRRAAEDPPGGPAPPALGPWRLISQAGGRPGPDRLLLSAGVSGGRPFWAGEDLLASALARHYSPTPGAPETRGRPLLVLAGRPSAALAAAGLAGAGPAALISEPESLAASAEMLALNRLPEAELINQPATLPARLKAGRAARFGLIIIHLSPYLAARRLKHLAAWLAPEGVIWLSGFAPGPQTAHLLRASARAGLMLSESVFSGDWAALKLEAAPPREELPPLTGSLVPELLDLPEEEDQEEPAPENVLMVEDADEEE